jgi:hypothetical protein
MQAAPTHAGASDQQVQKALPSETTGVRTLLSDQPRDPSVHLGVRNPRNEKRQRVNKTLTRRLFFPVS